MVGRIIFTQNDWTLADWFGDIPNQGWCDAGLGWKLHPGELWLSQAWHLTGGNRCSQKPNTTVYDCLCWCSYYVLFLISYTCIYIFVLCIYIYIYISMCSVSLHTYAKMWTDIPTHRRRYTYTYIILMHYIFIHWHDILLYI